MNWQVPKLWSGGEVWIIGGGPSVAEQFSIPTQVTQDVIKGVSTPSAFSPYMSCLHKKHVIAINVAFMIGDWVDMVFFGDTNFFLPNQERLTHFPGLKVCCNPQIEKYNWVKFLSRDNERIYGISQNPKKVSWNGNSGAAAINVAVHAGAKRIFLLGFDMKLNDSKQQHWHDLYKTIPKLQTKGGVRHLPFNKHLLGFPYIARDAKRLGVEIINVSPDSAIQEFPKMTLAEALHLKEEMV